VDADGGVVDDGVDGAIGDPPHDAASNNAAASINDLIASLPVLVDEVSLERPHRL
jgi:hypothetical protein